MRHMSPCITKDCDYESSDHHWSRRHMILTFTFLALTKGKPDASQSVRLSSVYLLTKLHKTLIFTRLGEIKSDAIR